MKYLVFSILFILLTITTSAFEIQHTTSYTDRNGLTQNTVRCIMQDSNGFMWMGTVNGLNRFNGKEFVEIKLRTHSSISDNRIRSIIEDKNGFIWIRTFSNTIFCYNPRLEAFVDYYPEDTSKRYTNITIASTGDVWLHGPQGCCRVRYSEGKFQVWNPGKDKLQKQHVLFLLEDSKQRVWIGYENELVTIDGEVLTSINKGDVFFSGIEYNDQMFLISNGHIAVFDDQKKNVEISAPTTNALLNSRSCLLNDGLMLIAGKDNMYAFNATNRQFVDASALFKKNHLNNASFYIDNKKNIWVYNMSGTLWRHQPDNTFEALRLFPQEILSLINQERYEIYHDSRDIVWITTFGNGLFAFDAKSGNIYHYTADKDLLTNYLFCVTEDRSGEIWVGTELAGVSKISLPRYPFDVIYPNPKGNSDRDNAVRLLYEDTEGNYWFGTRDGNLHIYNSQFEEINVHKIKGGLPFTIAEDSLGYKWLGTKGHGILIFPPKGNTTPQTHYLYDKERQIASSNNIYTIIRDSKNRMWIASFAGGLHLAQYKNNKLISRQFYLKQGRSYNMMRSMIQDHTGLIWVGCNEGIVIFDPDKIIKDENSYVNLRIDTGRSQSLNSNEVRVVFEDKHNRIWFGTTGGGLYLLERETPIEKSSFVHYNAQNGLSNEMIQAIQEDDEGNIWVSTESGISKFNPQSERFENFVFSNNRQSAIFNELSSWRRKTGELMFGSYNGIYMFNPSKMTNDTYAPPVVMTGLRINGNVTMPGEKDSPLSESIVIENRITLKHNQNSFNLEFTMPNYYAPELNQYMYILEGFEKNWNPISRNNIATFRNIPSGTYLFKVKASNSFGVWNDQETTLQIIIRPPWWKSAWAIVIYLVFFTIASYFAFRIIMKMHRLNTAVEVEKQLTEYKLRFFTNISHEFRTPLTIIRGAVEDLGNMDSLPSPVKRQLNILTRSSNRLIRLIDQLLEFRRLQNNKMELRLELTETKGFFYDIYSMFKDMAGKKQITFLFETNRDECTLLIDRSKMDKIAYNLLSNAFKNTPKGGEIIMKLQFSTDTDTFTLTVSDSGKGIPKEHLGTLFERFKQFNYSSEGTGIGLHLTSELVKVHKGHIIYEKSDLGGAGFSVTTSLSGANYDEKDIVSHYSTTEEELVISDSEVDEHSKIVSGQEMNNIQFEKSYNAYKVLVIEDDEDVQVFLERQLSQYFTVSVASNGVEGLAKLKEEQYDMVVCDVMMPEMDGYNFTKHLKEDFETSHIPVILLTAYSSEEHQIKGIQTGADSYITKPFSGKYLLTRIVKLIEQREKLQHRFATEPGLLKTTIGLTVNDKTFLNQLHEIIDKNFMDTNLKIESFAPTFHMGRTTLFRKIKGLTGYTPSEYLKVLRMKKVAELLTTTNKTISEISYEVGLKDPFYLSRCFKAQFGISPSQYRIQQ